MVIRLTENIVKSEENVPKKSKKIAQDFKFQLSNFARNQKGKVGMKLGIDRESKLQ